MKTTPLALASLCLLAGLTQAAAASADHRRGDDPPPNQARAHSHRADTQAQSEPSRRPRTEFPAAGTPSRQPNRHFPPDYYLNRPGGSALNAPPGFYRDNLSYDPPRHHHHGDDEAPVFAPTYVVVQPAYPYYSEPLAIGPTRGPEDAVEPVQSEPLDYRVGDPYGVEPVREPRGYAPRAQRVPSAQPLVTEVVPEPPQRHPTEPSLQRPTEPQLVHIDVAPADAEIWLDDEFLGTAGELNASLVLSPGVYLLEVGHGELPGERLFFGVVDQQVDVRVDLRVSEPRRRYRVR